MILALFGSFYYTARGGSPIMGMFMTVGVTLVVTVGSLVSCSFTPGYNFPVHQYQHFLCRHHDQGRQHGSCRPMPRPIVQWAEGFTYKTPRKPPLLKHRDLVHIGSMSTHAPATSNYFEKVLIMTQSFVLPHNRMLSLISIK